MSPEEKNVWDVILTIIAMLGTGVGFWFGLRQWRRGQDWQRAEQMDKFIRQFESDELLRLAATVVDWTRRSIYFRGRELIVSNTDCLRALRHHEELNDDPRFPGEQSTLRDAYDALLSFFGRLDIALTTQLIDRQPAQKYFAYWLDHFLRFDRHPDENNLLKGKKPAQAVSDYVQAYGDPEAIRSLSNWFGILDQSFAIHVEK